MRSAGCIINDMWDAKLDAQVERTRHRPLAAGRLSYVQALRLLIALLGTALFIVMQLRIEVTLYAVASLPLVILYPLCKRFTWWPQAVLGLTFNFGALMGWVAVTGHIALPAITLYIAAFFWTLGYDTLYGYQDMADDAKIGIKSSALKTQHHPKSAMTLFYALSALAIIATFYLIKAPFIAVLMLTIPLALGTWQIKALDIYQPLTCHRLFILNNSVGFALFLSCTLLYYEHLL